jgi:hypothetical protein
MAKLVAVCERCGAVSESADPNSLKLQAENHFHIQRRARDPGHVSKFVTKKVPRRKQN